MSNPLTGFLQWVANLITTQPVPKPTPMPQPDPEPPVPPVQPGPASPTTLVLQELNAARANSGLQALAEDGALDRISAEWAGSMASSGVMGHGDFAGRITSVYPNTNAGENIAEGQPDAASVVDAWMSDPPHRSNILGDYNRVGIGIAQDASGTHYWCTDFVKLSSFF